MPDGMESNSVVSTADSEAILSEMHRVLKPGGILLVVSYEKYEARLPFLQQAHGFDVEPQVFCKSRDWYMYRCAIFPRLP